ncbi:uncharacterized protein BO97DRAFT_93009 [Aspergillus homomorphus CBS 101889]|uniref:Uncharacterized protein n=1 Tax=Aspergillus homomorphus (strain CBS 101889) TaxID=1450537 RepID=A0A395HW83_ASPHC|nr:hypothetical protein BO97DRAFT_93009 [Aspergillus homomorphus CBS 101889]RAL11683.1 hypothetical protein BO97DRAFT_93009 [Aspergillus homomorphus CBS 101889]
MMRLISWKGKSAFAQETERGADIPYSSWLFSLAGLLSNLPCLCNSTGLGSIAAWNCYSRSLWTCRRPNLSSIMRASILSSGPYLKILQEAPGLAGTLSPYHAHRLNSIGRLSCIVPLWSLRIKTHGARRLARIDAFEAAAQGNTNKKKSRRGMMPAEYQPRRPLL